MAKILFTAAELVCLESLAYHGFALKGSSEPEFMQGRQELALRRLMCLLFGRRVMDAAEGPTRVVGTAVYDARPRIPVRFADDQLQVARDLVAWARDGNVDMVLINRQDQFPSVANRFDEAQSESESGAATPRESGRRTREDADVEPVVLTWHEVIQLLEMHRGLFAFSWNRRGSLEARHVGQERLRPAYWRLYDTLGTQQEDARVSLSAAQWSDLALLYPPFLWNESLIQSLDEELAADIVRMLDQDELRKKLNSIVKGGVT